ncbi:hypothetical protein RJT34_06520 [Clitoria ternatea]|uniref:Uncharacterized protein n=1 Tax=Clitoria ternatea TaxID=43366 RepID=A0AAN9PUC9_CLITE
MMWKKAIDEEENQREWNKGLIHSALMPLSGSFVGLVGDMVANVDVLADGVLSQAISRSCPSTGQALLQETNDMSSMGDQHPGHHV